MPQSGYPFRNLIFECGGVKGIAYSGALAVLKQRGILRRIQRVGGASAGAINATLLALGYSLEEIRDILAKLDFRNFMDDDWGVLRDAKRLVRDFGWYKGDFFRQWMAHLVEAKTGNPDATFADLAKRRSKAEAASRRHQLGHAPQPGLLERPLAHPAGGRRRAPLDVHPAILRRRARVGRFVRRWRRGHSSGR